MTSVSPDHEGPFRDLYRTHFDAVLAYAIRRTEQPADAGDVVAETFLVAWRRKHEIPEGPGGRLWLFGVARRVLANHRRGGRRRHQLGERLCDRLTAAVARDHADDVATRALVVTAMRRLGELDRETLALSAWEELEPREIAEVLGISADAARTRLSRARGRMRELLGHDGVVAGHVLDAGRPAVPARLNPEEYR